jgi:superfamily II DNA or RNA helicase
MTQPSTLPATAPFAPRPTAPPPQGPFDSTSETETQRALVQLAHRHFGSIPANVVANHVLRLHPDTEWPVRRAAMEALIRRWSSAQRDGLRVARRPNGTTPLGLYETRRPRGRARPYRTWLETAEPLEGSCDCPDFARSSLGLCKHLLTVLDEIGRKPRLWERALRSRASARTRMPRLLWDPVRPLRGPGDWLARVRVSVPPAGQKQRGALPSALHPLRRHFRPGPNGEVWTLDDAPLESPTERLALVTGLLGFQRSSGGRGVPPIEPALQALLGAERDTLALRAEGVERRRESRKALRSLRQCLYPYQQEAVERFLAQGRLLLADDMGLGKTAQAIASAHALFHTGRVRRGLFIVPASLKSQWEREWQLFSDTPIAVVEGPPEERAAAYRRMRRGFLVVNYEQTFRDLEWMQGWKPDLVVLDEAQRIKNWATKTAAAVKQLRPPYRLILTGTPMENRLEELASLMDWVDDHAVEPKWRLVPWHTVHADGRRAGVGARNLSTLRERLAPSMLRRVRQEVLDQLPPRTDSVLPLPMTPAQQDEHDALLQPIAQLIAIAKRRALTQAEFLRLMTLLTTQRIIANGLAQLRFTELWPSLRERRRVDDALLESLNAPKLGAARDLLTGLAIEQPGRKVVVFSQWRRMLELTAWAVRTPLADAGLEARFFTGAEGQRRRTQNIVDLHDDPAVAVLFLTDAGGVGLNLQRAASAVVNLDLPWNPAVLEQRIGRIYRPGQTMPIEVYNLVSVESIEERIASLVSDKRALFEGLFDGTDDTVRFERDGSFLAGIRALVASEPAPGPARGAEATPTDGEDDDPETDAAAEAEIDALVAHADESQDDERAALSARPIGGEPVRRAADSVAAGPPSGEQVGVLLSSLEIHPTDSGGVRIEAPPEAAETLISLFRGLAEMLERSRPH